MSGGRGEVVAWSGEPRGADLHDALPLGRFVPKAVIQGKRRPSRSPRAGYAVALKRHYSPRCFRSPLGVLAGAAIVPCVLRGDSFSARKSPRTLTSFGRSAPGGVTQ